MDLTLTFTSAPRSTRQLDFITVSKANEVLIGASNLINSGNWNGDLIYFRNDQDVPYNEDVFNVTQCLKHYLPVSVCDGTFIEENKVIVGNDYGMLCIYTIDSSESTHEDADPEKLTFYNNVCTVEHDRSILSLSVSFNGRKVATGSMDRSIKLWDVEMFIAETTYTNAHSHYVTCVCYKPESIAQTGAGDQPLNNRVLISTSLDGRCLLWDSRQQFPAQVITTSAQCGYTYAEWFNSGDKFFLGCDDGTLSLFDVRNTSTHVQNYHFFKKYINRIVSFYRNSEKYVAVCEDSTNLKVFRYEKDNSLNTIYSNSEHKDYVKGLSWIDDPSNPILLSCSWDSRVINHHPFESVS